MSERAVGAAVLRRLVAAAVAVMRMPYRESDEAYPHESNSSVNCGVVLLESGDDSRHQFRELGGHYCQAEAEAHVCTPERIAPAPADGHAGGKVLNCHKRSNEPHRATYLLGEE